MGAISLRSPLNNWALTLLAMPKSAFPKIPTRRMSSSKRLRLAVFVDDHDSSETWMQTMRRWNRRFPDDAYSTVSLFHRDATQANRRLRERAGLT
jgi:hypothetical protein